MKYIVILILILGSLHASKIIESKWKEGQTFSQYLELNNISVDVLDSISKEDQKFLSEINSNYSFYELKEKGVLLQALIPISEVMQIHLTKSQISQEYEFDIIPIAFEDKEYFAKIKIHSNPYSDTLNTVHHKQLAKRLTSVLKGIVKDKSLHRGDEIDFIYMQSTRVGKPYLMPHIKIARVVTSSKVKFIYVDEDGDGFAQTGKSVAYAVKGKRRVTYTKRVPVSKQKAMFDMPLRRARITSNFSYSRWHPILHQYRPHHGTDFGAKRGTPLLAVNAGRVSFAGVLGGYGNVVKIRHGDGYESLYAHQSRIRVKRGEVVRKGQVIGYVGSTGRSTGPHLHFGLKKDGRWVDPMDILRKKSLKTTILKKFVKYENVTTRKYKTVEIKGVKENKEKLLHYVQNNAKTYIWSE